MGGGWGGGAACVVNISVHSTPFCCEPKIVPENKAYRGEGGRQQHSTTAKAEYEDERAGSINPLKSWKVVENDRQTPGRWGRSDHGPRNQPRAGLHKERTWAQDAAHPQEKSTVAAKSKSNKPDLLQV